ncbi:MAG TPA: DUF3499 family protein [Acidimicrobiales bacterium]|nr:DUF3499 family protein [Acidimicrobiales bacterium]
MQRHCARPGCATTATATLTYDYSGGTVWIDRLTPEAHPMTHDLCTRHADALGVPRGWLLQDRRPAAAPLFSEPHSGQQAGSRVEAHAGRTTGQRTLAG